jgi:hypothetical protein
LLKILRKIQIINSKKKKSFARIKGRTSKYKKRRLHSKKLAGSKSPKRLNKSKSTKKRSKSKKRSLSSQKTKKRYFKKSHLKNNKSMANVKSRLNSRSPGKRNKKNL